ncbi:hypothetical protein [Escherichia coli]|nr:hypothetical protein [Escherichia coli]
MKLLFVMMVFTSTEQLLPYSKPLSVDPGGRKLPAIRESIHVGVNQNCC